MQCPLTHTEAVYRLRSYQPWAALSRMEATAYLEERLLTYQFLSLYQTFFPQQFAASTTSLYRDGEGHSQRDLEFLKLLDQHYFPISEWKMEQAHESPLATIPLCNMGTDWQDEDGLENLKAEWKILLPLTHEGRHWLDAVDPDSTEWYEGEFGFPVSAIQPPDQVPAKQLRQRCLRAGQPFKFLPLALSLLDKSTGNAWLDEPNEAWYETDCGTQAPWLEESIRHLTKQWRQAQRSLNLAFEFSHWLAQDRNQHFMEVLVLWNKPYSKL
jgi:hypothetical protein